MEITATGKRHAKISKFILAMLGDAYVAMLMLRLNKKTLTEHGNFPLGRKLELRENFSTHPSPRAPHLFFPLPRFDVRLLPVSSRVSSDGNIVLWLVLVKAQQTLIHLPLRYLSSPTEWTR